MLLVEEKMGATARDEDDELLLVFRRLAGGEVGALIVLPVAFDRNCPIFCFFLIDFLLLFQDIEATPLPPKS